jgi:hypothetical protein
MTWKSTPAVKRYYLLVFEFKPREYPVGVVSRYSISLYTMHRRAECDLVHLSRGLLRGAKKEKGGLDRAKQFAQLAYGCKGCCAVPRTCKWHEWPCKRNQLFEGASRPSPGRTNPQQGGLPPPEPSRGHARGGRCRLTANTTCDHSGGNDKHPRAEASRDHSGGNVKQADVVHLSSPVHQQPQQR